jgi:hypothetical protein
MTVGIADSHFALIGGDRVVVSIRRPTIAASSGAVLPPPFTTQKIAIVGLSVGCILAGEIRIGRLFGEPRGPIALAQQHPADETAERRIVWFLSLSLRKAQ